ncbi:MAG TPA: hypothetical protein VGM41_13320 [Chitinophagaceae bacterium]
MVKKINIVYSIFTVALFYIVSPWFFERAFLFNEILSAAGLFILAYKHFRIGKDPISICVVLLLLLGGVHVVTSLFRMDSFYYYLRNTVIVYSMLAFFIGFYWLKYLGGYLNRIRRLLRYYIGIFLLIPLPRFLFERFGMAMLFPVLFKKASLKWVFPAIIVINIIYGITYGSVTAVVLALLYMFLLVAPSYKFFMQVTGIGLLLFACLFIYLVPNLSLISRHYSHNNYNGILEVMRSSRILSIDGNSTWRLVLWKQIIVDKFPANIFGIGFGTPALRYFPVEDFTKIPTLPYVLGAHNSFVYLFGRLGILYVLIIANVYRCIFKEYFYYKRYYYSNNQIMLFWSFLAITGIALFNPTLESPIYASAYWLILGFTARAIHQRKFNSPKPPAEI